MRLRCWQTVVARFYWRGTGTPGPPRIPEIDVSKTGRVLLNWILWSVRREEGCGYQLTVIAARRGQRRWRIQDVRLEPSDETFALKKDDPQ